MAPCNWLTPNLLRLCPPVSAKFYVISVEYTLSGTIMWLKKTDLLLNEGSLYPIIPVSWITIIYLCTIQAVTCPARRVHSWGFHELLILFTPESPLKKWRCASGFFGCNQRCSLESFPPYHLSDGNLRFIVPDIGGAALPCPDNKSAAPSIFFQTLKVLTELLRRCEPYVNDVVFVINVYQPRDLPRPRETYLQAPLSKSCTRCEHEYWVM